jgi:hypothetical protein
MEEHVTPKEAAKLCRYSRGSNFLRAFRAAGYETVGKPGKVLVKKDDLESFLYLTAPQCVSMDLN